MTTKLSIIIPTYNRTNILRKCLDCLANQTFKDFEVIVVSDGPDKKTAEMFQGLEWPFEIQYFSIPKSQQGVCRNRAVEKARGEYALLIGDDFFLAPDACERHMQAHEAELGREDGDKKKPIAVLGFSTWDPSINPTSLMKWIESNGIQFGYPKIKKYEQSFIPEDIQHFFTYTSNISLPAKALYQNKFLEDVSMYGWEDVEWGARLADEGIKLFYEPGAKAYHHHPFTDREIWQRSRLIGSSAKQMEKIAPDMNLTPKGLKLIAYFLNALLPTRMGRHRREFLKGMLVSS
jgi:glycosyltransferase involved in cell wall biosynthesis